MKKRKGKKIKVLFIEDDPFLLSMYSSKFEAEGFDVISASDGKYGLELAENEIPDIILLDIMIPEKNGFEVLESLKADQRTSQIPVILLTNLNQRDEVEKGMAMGAHDYLIKAHFIPSEIVNKIKKLINGEDDIS